MPFTRGVKTATLCLGVLTVTSMMMAQSASQDYARYASMLNQERADTAKREQQAMYDQSSRNSRYSGNSGTSGGSTYSSGGSSTKADLVGLLGKSLNDFAARRNERALERQRAEAAYEEKMRVDRAEGARMSARIMGTDRPLIQQNLEKAAKGNAQAMAEAGLQYADGLGVAKNLERGRELLLDAANHGDVPTMARLAFWYRHPEAGIMPLDLAQSNAWLIKAASGGDLVSQATLGFFYTKESGSGLPDNPLEALRWSKTAADRGSASGAENTATYLSGFDGIPADRAQSEFYYRKAIALGSPSATDHLIRLLENDDRTNGDLQKAFELRLALAEKGDPVQEAMIGVYYCRGYDRPVDIAKGFEWFNRAAAHGSGRALYEMAMIYDGGIGVPKDREKARPLLRQAAVQGFAKALYVLAYCTLEGDLTQQDEIEGERLMRLAAEKGDDQAPYILAQIYREGYSVDKSHAEEIRWLRLGAARGNEDCIKQLNVAGLPLVDPAPPGAIVATPLQVKTEAATTRVTVEAKQATFTPVQIPPANAEPQRVVSVSSAPARTVTIGTVSSYDDALKEAHDRIANVKGRAHSHIDFAYNMVIALYEKAKATRPSLTPRAFVLELHDLGVAGDVVAAYRYAAARLAKIGFDRISNKEAEGYVRAAKDIGLPEAERDYGVLLIHGIGLPEDHEAGYALVKKAADAGLVSAITLQGELMFFGNGTTKAPDDGIALWKKAADAGDPIGQHYYGLSQKKDHPDIALVYLKKAADAGDDRAMFSYGWALDNGFGTPADPVAGLKWIDRAAMAGHPQAQSVMGAKYAEGEGVPEDAAYACFYWEAGAKNGWPGAQLNYGLRKINGDGTAPDRAEGISWLKKAAEQGNESAVEELAKLDVD